MVDFPVRDTASYMGYTTGWTGVRWMPEVAAYRMFRGIADGAFRRNGKSVKRLRDNLRRARPDASPAELDAIVHAGMRSYMRYWCDAFRLPDWRPEDIPGRVVTRNQHIIMDQMATGQGVVAALPHMGNWDLAGAWACLQVGPVTTVAEQLKPPRLYERFVSFREQLGMEILPMGGSGLMDQLTQAVHKGRIVPLLSDRDLTRSGVQVDFLGEPAMVPAGPAVLSIRTGVPLMPATLAYVGEEPAHKLEITFHELIEVSHHDDPDEQVRITLQGLADALSEGIREHPEAWHMLQRVFVADLDPRRSPASSRGPA